MNSLGMTLKHLSRRTKLLLLVFSDCLIAFFCWVIFGPPFSFMIATNFELSLKDIVLANLLSFFIPFIFTFLYFKGFLEKIDKPDFKTYLDYSTNNQSRIRIIKTNRGGKTTYHGPGQRIVYFMINLNNKKKDIRKFISVIEKSLMDFLKNYQIA